MLDDARNWMNNNSATVTVIAVVILVGAIAFMVGRKIRPPTSAGQAWYFDTTSGEYFTDVTTKLAPFKRDNGNLAVRAHFFTCGECTTDTGAADSSKRFIGYYEKYTDEVRAKLQETTSESFAMYDMNIGG